MISRNSIAERARAWGISENIVEKDYVIGWLLWGISSHPDLSKYWAFKGGTCLKKCFFETYRFSEDLDFSVLPGSPFLTEGNIFAVDEVKRCLGDVLERVQEESGINLGARELYLKSRHDGRALEGRIYYLGPFGSTQIAKVKLDISATEVVVRPTVLREIRHGFPDDLPAPSTVRCYSFEEIFAEKIRAMGERGRPRDLYDIVNLYRHRGLGRAPALIREVLVEKCDTKGVPVPTFDSVVEPSAREELESEWENMLGHQLPSTPDLGFYLAELDNLFLWLSEELVFEELPAAAVGGNLDADWEPPPIASTWDGVPIESIRFAAANLLLVKLGYKGDHRVVEPYSLRRTNSGDLLLYAQRPEEPHIKAYRVDKIESVEIQQQVFEPRYPVEFTPGGAITARPTTRGLGGLGGSRRRPSSSTSFRYVIECPYCGKKFRRKKLSTKLNPHKTADGYPCSGRQGFTV